MGIGEAGTIMADSPIAETPITVTLEEPLTDPVFAFTSTNIGGDDFNIRLVGQTLDADGNTTAFEFIIEEWESGINSGHGTIETVNWLAIEAGVHTLADGRIIEAGTTPVSSTANNTGTSETFSAGFTGAPIVLTSVMSDNGPATVDSDPSNITSTGFDLTLQEETGSLDPAHAEETIGWIAIQPGGQGVTTSGTATLTGTNVDHIESTHNLGATFTNGVVLAETQTLEGAETAVVTITGQTSDEVTIFINEDPSATNPAHAEENVGIVTFESGVIPCFTRGTLIATDGGERRIETFAVGDQVLTADCGSQNVHWIGRRQYTADELAENPKLRPVRIVQGALGAGLPRRDLLVSRQHRMLVRSKICQRMFDRPEVLVAAIKLIELPGIFVDEEIEQVEYIHLLFAQHELIYAEGTLTESLYTGTEALKALSDEARDEILTIFPELAQMHHLPKSTRFIPHAKQQRKLVARHAINKKPLLH